MTIKEKLLTLLEQSRGEFLSGEAIAQNLNVTRAAVWKAIDALRKDGFIIDAQTNKGYALTAENDKLTLSGVMQGLAPNSPIKIELFDSVSSTNTVIRDKSGENEGLVAVANTQTGGMGRMGRSFVSPPDTGIYFSILLKPAMPADKITFITTMAGVAVCRAIASLTDKQPKIKWVNDVFVDGKKVCGILTQASFSLENNGLEYAVLGIGINAYLPKDGFDDEIKSIVGAVLDKPQGNFKNMLLAETLNNFWQLYTMQDYSQTAKEYCEYSLVTGKEIMVLKGNTKRQATALDIDDDCRLIVKYEDGTQEALSTNEISIRGAF